VILYEGTATIATAEGKPFEIVCTIRSRQEQGFRPAFEDPTRVSAHGPADWGGSFMLVSPRDRTALTVATSANQRVILRLGDGREATAYISNHHLKGSGDWPTPP
jgi:hypothetical protein